MGLVNAAVSALSGVLADQWRDYYYAEALPAEALAVKAKKRVGARSSNKKGNENIISNGSIIAVNDGQFMIIVEQGKIVEVCAEPGEFVYDTSTEASMLFGDLEDNIVATFKNFGKRFTFGGDTAKDQRIYFINRKEIMGNKYGTPSPVPFRVVDTNIGLDIDISIRCHGQYSYRIVNPLAFYANVCANAEHAFVRGQIDGQLKSELLTALQPAFAKISEMGIRYSSLPGHTQEMADVLNQILSEKWMTVRGIQIVSFGVSAVKASEEDEAMLKQLQRNAVMRNPDMAAAHLVAAQADAMTDAANNNGGTFMGFAGMNLAQQAGGLNAANLFNLAQQQRAQQQTQAAAAPQKAAAPATDSWKCACGAHNSGRFCSECGTAKPASAQAPAGWSCTCGTVNKGRFCSECGTARPAGEPAYACDKCGWEPADPAKPPKFCPECGDIFDDNDKKQDS